MNAADLTSAVAIHSLLQNRDATSPTINHPAIDNPFASKPSPAPHALPPLMSESSGSMHLQPPPPLPLPSEVTMPTMLSDAAMASLPLRGCLESLLELDLLERLCERVGSAHSAKT